MCFFPFPLACSELPRPFGSFPPIRCTLASDSAVLTMEALLWAGMWALHLWEGPCPWPPCIKLFSWYCFLKMSTRNPWLTECWLHTGHHHGPHACVPALPMVSTLFLTVSVMARAPASLRVPDLSFPGWPFSSFLFDHQNQWQDIIMGALAQTWSLIFLYTNTLFSFWNGNANWSALIPPWPKPLLLASLFPGSATHSVYQLSLWPLTSVTSWFSEHCHMGMTLPDFRLDLYYGPEMSLPWLSLSGPGLWLCFFFFFLFSGEPPGSPALQADSLPTELWGKSWSISDPCNLKKKKKKKKSIVVHGF